MRLWLLSSTQTSRATVTAATTAVGLGCTCAQQQQCPCCWRNQGRWKRKSGERRQVCCCLMHRLWPAWHRTVGAPAAGPGRLNQPEWLSTGLEILCLAPQLLKPLLNPMPSPLRLGQSASARAIHESASRTAQDRSCFSLPERFECHPTSRCTQRYRTRSSPFRCQELRKPLNFDVS